MNRFEITLTGLTPLLHHADNLKWRGVMQKWAKDPANKGTSVAGDDRSPAFRWIGHLYRFADKAIIPSDNLMTMFREGGAKCLTGKRQQTFKALTQSGMMVDSAQWDVIDPRTGKAYDVTGVEDLTDEPDFEVHEAWAVAHGFELFSKPAAVNGAKHVRVRPRFDAWEARGTVTVFNAMITTEALTQIIAVAGAQAGICDWRPSSPKSPGPYGRFDGKVKKVKS